MLFDKGILVTLFLGKLFHMDAIETKHNFYMNNDCKYALIVSLYWYVFLRFCWKASASVLSMQYIP